MEDSIFIVGGGPSLKDFPFEKLRDLNTIAVNVAALDVPNPTYCITADSGILQKIQNGYFKKVKTSWVLVTNEKHCSMQMRNGRFINTRSGFVYNLFCVNMLIRSVKVEGIGFAFNDFRTGYNSGFCALQLAVLLGYKKIYLLGIDLVGDEESHYHNRYKGRKIARGTFEKFNRSFSNALGIIKEMTDIEIVSCSAKSKLNFLIPYVAFEKVIENE